jgi:hypothetical protein
MTVTMQEVFKLNLIFHTLCICEKLQKPISTKKTLVLPELLLF